MKINQLPRYLTVALLLCISKTTPSTCQAGEHSIMRFTLPTETLDLAKQFLPDNPVIIDAGAHDGTESTVMAKQWPNGHVHAFEPVPEIYQCLLNTTKDFSNISTYNFALSHANEAAEMFISEWVQELGTPSHSSSLLYPKDHLIYAPHVVFPKLIMVDTFTIDTWAVNNNIDHVDMLWLDMQGVELNVIKASPNILKGVKVILTEVEFVEAYEGQYLYDELKSWLEELGFVLMATNFNPNNPRERFDTYCGDALFVRKSNH